MPYRYVFYEAAARDLFKLTQRNHRLLYAIGAVHIPAILLDLHTTGKKKKGKLAHVWDDNIKVDNVAYRMVYEIDGDVVRFIAVGPHDEAYERAEQRA